MEATVAKAVIIQAKELGFYDDPLPEHDLELISEAEAIVNEAAEAFKNGARGDVVVSILETSRAFASEEASEQAPEEPVAVAKEPQEIETTAERPSGLNNIDTVYEAKEIAQANIKKERLPLPPEIDGEPPVLPRDFSVVGELELRRLHSEFNACLARANWLVAVEEADELAARQIADYYQAKAVKKAGETTDPVTGKAKTVAAMEAEAAGDPDVRHWRQLATGHHIEAKLLKALRDTYQSNCDRISREYTMRSGER